MTSTREFYETIRAELADIAPLGGRIYDMNAGESVPSYPNGQVMPYVVMIPRVATAVDDEPVSGSQIIDARTFQLQVTCTAGDITTLMDMADAVDFAVTGTRVGDGELKRAPLLEPNASYLWDSDVFPHRPWVPLVWTVTT